MNASFRVNYTLGLVFQAIFDEAANSNREENVK
jgi:hypothetical protein